MSNLLEFFNSDNFMPHGHCFLWQKDILYLHILSDAGIAFAYFSIPLLLFYLIRARKDLPFKFLFAAFSAFIWMCGITHLMGIWVLWHPDYALDGILKAVTAVISVATVFLLGKVIPKALLYIPANAVENALQLKLLANSLPQLVWMADEKGKIYWYNERWYSYTGTTLEQMEGWGWMSVHDPATLPKVMEKWTHALTTGEPFEMIFPLRGADGEFRPFLTRANAVRNSQGTIIHWFGTNTDVTEQERAAHQVEESERRWRMLTEATPQLVWINSGTSRGCEYLSRQWQDYTGIPTEQLLGDEWLKVIHPDDQMPTKEKWMEAVKARADVDVLYRLRRYDGAYRWFKVRGVPSLNEQSNIEKWYGTCTDIQELVDERERAEEANRAKTEFLANMSHEIRTPMNAVIGLSNILAITEPLTARQREFIATLQLSADALLALINDLLDIAKIETHTIELEKIPFNINDLVNEVASMMSVRAKEKKLSFTLDSKHIEQKNYIGDPARIRQIVINLCSNAIKFTEQGEVHVSIECDPTPDKPETGALCVKVKDSGIGISKAKQEVIFQKFIQGDASINRKYGGTGLGLAISKMLAEMMGGSICVESEEGKGSTFTLCLPLPRISQAVLDNALDSEGDAEAENPVKPSRPCVLLVEDYGPNVLVAGSFLDEFGYDYTVAANGAEAVETAKAGHYALILMDIQMHGMNGLEATRLIREYERLHHKTPTPILAMTAYALAGDRERCLAAGMNDYIAKPFNPKNLQEKLQALISPEEGDEALNGG